MATAGKNGRRIRIKSIPNGIADERIRAAWLGEELPVATEVPEYIRQVAERRGLLVVAREVALEALRASRKMFAVHYWTDHCSSGFFCFRPEHCEEVTG
jgi:hypothetical protein